MMLFRRLFPLHNGRMIYGYARVSTDGQTEGAQLEALTAAGAAKVFRETASGAQSDRAQPRKVLPALGNGDVLMVTRLDRLADPPATCSPWHRLPTARRVSDPMVTQARTPPPRTDG